MLASVGKAAAAFVGLGKKDKVVCDRAPGLNFTFEAERYMGTWYEIYHSSGEPFQATYTELDTEAADPTFKDVQREDKCKYKHGALE